MAGKATDTESNIIPVMVILYYELMTMANSVRINQVILKIIQILLHCPVTQLRILYTNLANCIYNLPKA